MEAFILLIQTVRQIYIGYLCALSIFDAVYDDDDDDDDYLWLFVHV